MAKRNGVKKEQLPKWQAQQRWCNRCSKQFQPIRKGQELCIDCSVLLQLSMTELEKNYAAK
jgi:hypothetical protein